ncbi:MAG: insulinase family protein [Gemmatimonadota bacterium]|nr:MAG: insulinase family protein [Gemmatimonadota bacterium]
MRKYWRFFRPVGLLLLVVLFTAGFADAQKGPKDKFEYPSLSKIEMPDVKEETLENGMKLFLVEDHQYPTVDLRAMIRTGSIYEPADKIGLASIVGMVLRTGGTETMTGDEIDELLESMGASVETSIGEGSGYVYVSVLKEDIEKGLEILADLLMHPAFPEDKIDLAKMQHRTGISRRNDDIGSISYREFDKIIYGAESPYARHTEYATIEAITRDDMVAFYERYFHPNNVIFAAWGDFKAKEIKAKIENAFTGWAPAVIEFPPKPQVEYEYKFSVNFIEKPDVNQSWILMGHIGGLKSSPHYPALIVMNQILSFDRLFKRIRSAEGLAYHVGGAYGADFDHPGVFYSICQTKSQSTVYAIGIMLEEIERITEEEVTDAELAKAKDSYLNSFVFNFDSKAEIVSRLMQYAYYEYASDFINRTKMGVENVTKSDVLQAAKENLRPDKLQILVVGKPEDFDEPLSVLGAVHEIDITIPTPEEEAPEATPESLEKGRALLAEAVEAMGGLNAFQAIANMKFESKITIFIPQGGTMEATAREMTVYPDKNRTEISLPFGQMIQVLRGDQAWATGPQGTQDLDESQRKDMEKSLFRDMVLLFQRSGDTALVVQSLGETEVAGKTAEEILIKDEEGNSVKMYLDKETHLVVKRDYQGTTMRGAASMEESLTDYREVDGIKIPFRSDIKADGEPYISVEVQEMLINTEIDPALFEK